MKHHLQVTIVELVPLWDMVQARCFFYLLHYLFALCAGAMMILVVGVDRLLALKKPLK